MKHPTYHPPTNENQSLSDAENESIVSPEQSSALMLVQSIVNLTSSNGQLDVIIKNCLGEICNTYNWQFAHLFFTNKKHKSLKESRVKYFDDPEKEHAFNDLTNIKRFPPVKGVPGIVLATQKPFWTERIAETFCNERANISREMNINSSFALPITFGDQVSAILEFFYTKPVNSRKRVLSTLTTVAAIMGQFIAHRKTACALKDNKSLCKTIIDDANLITWEAKLPDISITHVSSTAEKILGYPVKDWFKDDFRPNHMHPEDAGQITKYSQQQAKLGKDHSIEYRMFNNKGSIIWLKERMHVLLDDQGTPASLRGVTFDVTEERQLSEKLQFQSCHDLLTGLYNRHEFERRLEKLIAQKNTQKGHALCYIDLDQFKVINDSCGHLAGDELLRQISEVLKSHLRKQDTLARLGGDEFGILLKQCSLKNAKRIANNLINTIHDFRFDWEGKPFNISASIGLIPINGQSSTMQDALSIADIACYTAKDAGRNRVHIHLPSDDTLSEARGNLAWIAETNKAMEEGRMKLFMQPISLINDNSPENHFELLIRLQMKDGSIVPPGAFLPCLERYNLATRIDKWVVQTTFEWISEQPITNDCNTVCSINLSGQSLSNESFLSFILYQLQLNNIEKSSYTICFEVTETTAISNLNHAIHFLHVLQSKGCKTSLDDFGSGLSSFNYLKHLPVDYIKIDGAFIRDILDDPISLEMVRCINNIGHVMGKETIAEFVENDEMLTVLTKLGVDYAQGYGIGKPRPLIGEIDGKT